LRSAPSEPLFQIEAKAKTSRKFSLQHIRLQGTLTFGFADPLLWNVPVHFSKKKAAVWRWTSTGDNGKRLWNVEHRSEHILSRRRAGPIDEGCLEIFKIAGYFSTVTFAFPVLPIQSLTSDS
jgi:hypothetical protein